MEPSLGETAVSGGLASVFILALKEIIVKLFIRNGKEFATKEWVGNRLDRSKEEIEKELDGYPDKNEVQVLLLSQRTACLCEWHKIKDEIVDSVRAEAELQRREIKTDIEGVHSRLDKFIQSRV